MPAAFAVMIASVLPLGTAVAEEKSVAEQILDILKTNQQITEEQYKTLVAKAREEKQKGQDFDAFWKDGLNFESKDKQVRIKIGGRTMVDYAVIGADEDVERFSREQDEDFEGHGVEFRRARLSVEGALYEHFEFKTEFEFAGGDAEFTDVWLGLRELPFIGQLRVGHMKEPFSLEELTSSRFITFMERALPNAFAPARNTGFLIQNAEFGDRMTWAVGAFEETDDFGDAFADFSDYQVSARVTGLPWYCDEGRKLLHVGLGYHHKFRSEEDNPVSFANRPEAHLTDLHLVDTGDIPAQGVDIFNPEAALVLGPFSLQGEYFQAFVNAEGGNNPEFNGFYVFASYFITGENRNYKTSAAAFDRIKPKSNFHPTQGGWGAWEVAVRYSRIDLNDGDAGLEGGEEDNMTLGVNWYLNPNARVMLNYVMANIEDREGLENGDANIFESRFQVDF